MRQQHLSWLQLSAVHPQSVSLEPESVLLSPVWFLYMKATFQTKLKVCWPTRWGWSLSQRGRSLTHQWQVVFFFVSVVFEAKLNLTTLNQSHHLNCSAAHLVSEGSPEGAEPPQEEVGLIDGVEESDIERKVTVIESGVEPKSDPISSITAAFNTFKTQLEQHFTVSTHH